MSAIGGKMASLKRYRGRWSVKIRRKGHRGIYETFDKISDARSFINILTQFSVFYLRIVYDTAVTQSI